MGLMTYLRNKMHIILFTLLVLFVLSMTVGGLVGGANITDILSGKKPNVIGSVEGEDLDYNTFITMVQNEYQRLRDQGQQIDARTSERVRSQIWTSFVSETILKKISSKYGLGVTDQEVLYVLQNDPPEFLRSSEYFQTEGKFDMQKYLQALTNPQGDEWLGVEQYLKSLIPMQKVQSLIQSLPMVSEEEIKREFLKNYTNFSAEVIYLPVNSIPPDSITISEEELKTYYNEHLDNYKVEEQRKIKYYFIEKTPTREDSLSVLSFMNEIKQEILNGADFAEMANQYTEDPSGQGKGGSLGWFGKGRMVKQFEDAAFKAEKGEIVGPVLTPFGYHLILIEDKRGTGEKEEVKASHILMKISAGPSTIEKLQSQANLFAFYAREYGMEQAADSFQVELQESPGLRLKTPSLPKIGYFPDAAKFAFGTNQIGEISDVIENDKGYAILQLSEIIPEHHRTLEEVVQRIELKLKNKKIVEKLLAIANEIHAKLDSTTNFTDVITTYKEAKYTKVENQPLKQLFKELPRSEILTGAIIAMNEGEISPVLNLNQRAIAIMRLLKKTPFNEKDYAERSPEIAQKLIQSKRSAYYNKILDSIKEQADIKDFREKFF